MQSCSVCLDLLIVYNFQSYKLVTERKYEYYLAIGLQYKGTKQKLNNGFAVCTLTICNLTFVRLETRDILILLKSAESSIETTTYLISVLLLPSTPYCHGYGNMGCCVFKGGIQN